MTVGDPSAAGFPIWLMDFRVLRLLSKLNAVIYDFTERDMETIPDEIFERYDRLLANSSETLTKYVELRRRSGSFRLIPFAWLERRLSHFAAGFYAFSRGYAPGHLPTENERAHFVLEKLGLIHSPRQ